MSLSGSGSTFLPYTLNGLSDASFSNSNIGNGIATTLQVTSATPSKIARFDANQYLVSATVDTTDIVPYSGATTTVNLNSQNITTTRVPLAGSDITNKTYVDGAVSAASILATNNTFTGTNTFNNTVSLTSVATATASYTLGLNVSNQIVKYVPPTWIGGSITTGYIPYASAANTLADSLLYKSGNNTGIGTISPAGRFTIYATSAADADRLSSLVVDTYRAGIRLTSNGTAGCDWNFWVSTAGESPPQDALCFYNQGTSLFRMVITRDGIVSVGKDNVSPVVSSILQSGTSPTDSPYASATLFGGANPYYKAQICAFNTGGQALYLGSFYTASVGQIAVIQSSSVYSGEDHTSDLALQPNGGNVGIGVIAPTYKFQVAGTGLFGYVAGSKKGIFIANEDSYGTTPCIQGVSAGLASNDITLNPGGGSVAVGRLVPLHTFHVEGTIAGQTILSLFPALNGGAGSNINITAGNGAFGSIEAYNTANTVKLPLCLNAYGGNVGVGTPTPAYKLDVNGGSMRVNAGDSSRCVYGPNSTPGWGATLIVGAGPEVSGYKTAGITVTNGNLHLDAADSCDMYYGFYANSHTTPNAHLFYGGNYQYDSMPQNSSQYSQVCVMNGNRMFRSQAVAHQVVVYASNSWAGGTNLVNAFYRYNGYTSQMIIGRLSYYVTGVTQAYPTIRIYSQTTGQFWYFQTNNYTNVANNHITVPIYVIFNEGYTTATGWFDIYVYNGGNCVTDANDILDIHVITLPVSSY